jgi:hypothetical protein
MGPAYEMAAATNPAVTADSENEFLSGRRVGRCSGGALVIGLLGSSVRCCGGAGTLRSLAVACLT